VDAEGKVTSWRDYLDTNEPTQQIQAGLDGRAGDPTT
jgi:limonene-1,2-epoxide hydrolase